MRIGMIGLGKMGGSMARRLIDGGHRVIAFDPDAEARQKVVGAGADEATSVEELADVLEPPRAAWVMVPAGDPTDEVIHKLGAVLDSGDLVVDGGNSPYGVSMRHAEELGEKGIHFVDVGTSGGVWGLAEGYCLMVGGPDEAVERLRPIFETLAPAPDRGWGHVGPSGAGHFVKMVHNGIEYGLMQAYAEGFAVMEAKEAFDIDLQEVAATWRHGSVIRSWLLDLTERALQEDPGLKEVAPFVPDSGEGRWTVKEAIDLDVPAPVITQALLQRLQSRVESPFAHRLLAVLRNQFGGHAVKETSSEETERAETT